MIGNATIATGLAKIGMVMRSEAWRCAEATGLTPTQAQILAHVVQWGPARVGEVAQAVTVTAPTASDAVAALVRKGHLERQRDPDDARAWRLHATASGRHLAETLTVGSDALSDAIETLDPVEEAIVARGLVKIVRALQERNAIAVQRMCVTCQHFRPYAYSDAARPHHCAFVDAAFGEANLRLDCGDHVAADASVQRDAWIRFTETPA